MNFTITFCCNANLRSNFNFYVQHNNCVADKKLCLYCFDWYFSDVLSFFLCRYIFLEQFQQWKTRDLIFVTAQSKQRSSKEGAIKPKKKDY